MRTSLGPNWPLAVGIVLSAILLVGTVTRFDPTAAEVTANVACARLVTSYMAEIERLVTAPGLHGAARRATLEDRLRRACLRPL